MQITLVANGKASKWFPKSRLSLSEVMTIIVLFHLSGYRYFKWYYQREVCVHMRGKSSTGWFYDFKLHLVINDRGEICSFCLTPGNIDDRNVDVINPMCRELSGKLFGDRGYICQELFERLYQQGVQLITRLRKNMKNKLMDMRDKLLLRKRAVIESAMIF